MLAFLCAVAGSEADAQQLGVFTSLQSNEITPGLYIRFSAERVAYQWNMTVPILPHDPYNSNRSNISYWSPCMVVIGAAEYLGGVEMQFDSLSSFFGQLFFLLLPIASNGQLHVNLIANSSVDEVSMQASVFIGWDTALFGAREISWFRVAPKAGFSVFRLFGSPGKGKPRFSLGLQAGVKDNFDSPPRNHGFLVGFITLETGVY